MTLPFKYVAALAYAVLCSLSLAHAQATTSPFTVLSNNADPDNEYLFVELMYQKPACGDYKATFRLADKYDAVGSPIPVDSFMNNPGTYETEVSKPFNSLIRPQAGGYRLRFKIPKDKGADDNLRICVAAFKIAYKCQGCAAGGSNAIFGPADVDSLCPYKNPTDPANSNLLACYRRESVKANWEAWITDPRDCQPYRMVMMPDGRWWFAQNLNYTKELIDNDASTTGPTSATTNAADVGSYWCPGGINGVNGVQKVPLSGHNQSTNTYGLQGCKTYGALYTWTTAMKKNGRGVAEMAIGRSAYSVAQGICPDGWLLPGDLDWGVLLNSLEGCEDLVMLDGVAPCNHNNNSVSINRGSNRMFASIKATPSCPPHTYTIDSICATSTNPAWMWYRADYMSKLALPLYLGNDGYGFSLLPAGNREYNGTNGFRYVGKEAWHWTASQSDVDNGYMRRFISSDNPAFVVRNELKWYGASVRCVKPLPVTVTSIYSVSGKLAFTVLASGTASDATPYTYSFNGVTYTTNPIVTTMPITTAAGTGMQNFGKVEVKDANGKMVGEATIVYPAIPAGVTLCENCGYNGVTSSNVDLWLATQVSGALATTNAYGLDNATNINDGRQNMQRIQLAGHAGAGINNCVAKGSGWYVPAAQEYCSIRSANLHAKVATAVANTSTVLTASAAPMGISCWTTGEPNGNGPAIVGYFSTSFTLDDGGAITANTYTLCVWRP